MTTEKKKRRSLEQIKADIDARIEAKRLSSAAQAWATDAVRNIRGGNLRAAMDSANYLVAEVKRLQDLKAKQVKDEELRSPQLAIESTLS